MAFHLMGLSVVGVALLWATPLLYSQRSAASHNPLAILLWLSGWVLVWLGLLAAALSVGVLAWLAVPVTVIVALHCLANHRRDEKLALLELIALAAERQAPLDEAAAAFGRGRLDSVGQRSVMLAERLRAGEPLAVALHRSRLWAFDIRQLALELGAATGDLSGALQRLPTTPEEEEPLSYRLSDRLGYIALVFLLTLALLVFFATRIAPQFEAMFNEFDVDVPGPTLAALEFSRWYGPLGALSIFLLLLAAPVLVLWGMGIPLASVWPFFRPFRRRHGAQVARALAFLVERRLPLPECLQLLGRHYPNYAVSRRLSRAQRALESGAPWPEALARFGLIEHRETPLLASAEIAGNLPWALRSLAASRLQVQRLWASAWLHFLLPFGWALVVLLAAGFAASFLLPLIELIRWLAK